MTEPAATDRGTISGAAPSGPGASGPGASGPGASGPGASGPRTDSSAGLAGGLSGTHRVRRRDPVPLGAGLLIAVVGSLVLVIMDGSYLGLTVTTGVGYAIVTVGMVLQDRKSVV